MGKLTYSARKISGIKAGQAVSKDLKKRIPPGLGAKAAARDPTLEIDLEGKNLTDDGFAAFIDDMLACIKYRDEQHPLGSAKVTEFHLKGNQLTVQSLRKLGEVIALSPGDIRELDLSQNEIKVASAEEKEIWKAFLDSFKNCFMLKKLDLSANPIGPAGLEILARVFIKSDLDYLEADAEAVIGAELIAAQEAALAEGVDALKLGGDKDKENESPRAGRAKKSPNKGKAAKQNGTPHSTAAASKSLTVADLKKYACTRGLRSIPYLILSDISITNSSAVHLSSMLGMQRNPEQLLDFLPTGKAPTLPESAQDSKSIVWQPNNGLAPFAKRLLEVSEAILDSKSADSESEDSGSEQDTQRQLQSRLALEYSRLTKRVRLESLKDEGVRSSDIAMTALKMMTISRALLLEDKDRPVEEPLEDETALTDAHSAEGQTEEMEEAPMTAPETEQPTEHIEYVTAFPVGPFHPSAEMFDTEFPALPGPSKEQRITQLEPIAEEPVLEEHAEDAAPSSPSQPSRSGKGLSRHTGVSQKGRKQEWRFGLPFSFWRELIAEAVGAEGILDHEQQARIIHYASDWDVLAYELTIKGAEDHQQIWKFLETVNCFTYSPLS